MSNNIEQYLTIFVHSKQYLIISGNIYQYLTISNNIEQDSKLFCTPYDIIQFWNFFILLFFLYERVLEELSLLKKTKQPENSREVT